MRYTSVSTVLLFLLLAIVTALPVEASDVHPDDFEGWARIRSGEIDGRWIRAAAREAGTTVDNGARRTMTVPRRSPALRAGRPAGPDAGTSTGIDASRFTKRGSQDFLWRSTRERTGPTRGISRLENPAQAMRASALKRRLPFGTSSKYRRTTAQGRAGVWRKSPRMGTRLSTTGTRRRAATSSLKRGATRVRRSATRGF